jgi:hypothetical protein
MSGIIRVMSDSSRTAVDGIVRAIEDAREDLLQYNPPWLEPGYETLRIAIDRKLRSAQLAVTKLFDEATAPTEPPAGTV